MSDLTIKPAALDVKPMMHKATGKLALGLVMIDSDGQSMGRLLMTEEQGKALHNAIGHTLILIEALNMTDDPLSAVQ